MRWESNVKHAELTPVRTWSKKDEGNFGGRSLLTPYSDELTHHGVLGMRWGVQTKEYIKKGYNTLKRRQAILKMKRKAEIKARFQEGYERGQRVAANTHFIKNDVSKILAKKEAPKKQSITDRAVDKGTDFILKKSGLEEMAKAYGLDAFIPKAKDFLKARKNDGIGMIYNLLRDPTNQQKLQNALNSVLTSRIARSAARPISEFGSAIRRNAPDISARAIARGVKTAARAVGRGAVSGAKSGYRWLREGGARKVYSSVRSFNNTMSDYGRTLSRAESFVSTQMQRSVRFARQNSKNGYRALKGLLSKRPRRQ